MLIYDQCSQGWYMEYLMPLLEEVLFAKWFYFWCTNEIVNLGTYSYGYIRKLS
jgi:hypothetical protein